jgi:hypothetical protein
MAYNYGSDVRSAQKSIADAGAAVLIRRAGVDTPTFALLDITVENLTIDGDMVRVTDRFCYVAGGLPIGAIDPETDQMVVIASGNVYRIVTVKSIGPGGVTVIWLIQARL